MRVSVVRGGGLAGLVRRTELNSEDLATDDASQLAKLVDHAKLSTAPDAPASSATLPDEMRYELSVDEPDGARTARFSESTLPDPVRALITWVDGRPERSDTLQPPG